jgi:hypothetical protein
MNTEQRAAYALKLRRQAAESRGFSRLYLAAGLPVAALIMRKDADGKDRRARRQERYALGVLNG